MRRSIAPSAALAAMLAPPMFVVLARRMGDSLAVAIAMQLAYCATAVGIVALAVRREPRPWAAIGVRRPTLATFAIVLVVGAFTVLVLPMLTHALLSRIDATPLDAGTAQLARQPTWFRIALATTGGAVEEVLYRAIAIEGLTTLVRRRWVAGAIAALGFAFAHVPAWGVGFSLVADLPFGVVMTILYLARRDLVANVLVHGGGLVVAMLTLPNA